MKKILKNRFFLLLFILALSLFVLYFLTSKFLSIQKSSNDPRGIAELTNKYPNFDLFMDRLIEANPSIKMEDFVNEGTKNIDQTYTWEYTGEINPTLPEWIYSRNNKYAISTYLQFGNPDNSLDLYYSGSKSVESLAFCGTPCFFWGGFWLTDTSFVFIWNYVNEDSFNGINKDYYDLEIDIYDVEKRIISKYTLKRLDKSPKRPKWEDWETRENKINEDLYRR